MKANLLRVSDIKIWRYQQLLALSWGGAPVCVTAWLQEMCGRLGDCDPNKADDWREEGKSESKRLKKCRVCSEESACAGARIHVPKLWVEVTEKYLQAIFEGIVTKVT